MLAHEYSYLRIGCLQCGLLKDENIFVDFIDPEGCGVSQWAEVVIFAATVPDDNILENKSTLSHALGTIHVKRVEMFAFSKVHDDDNAPSTSLHYFKELMEHPLKDVEKFRIVGDVP